MNAESPKITPPDLIVGAPLRQMRLSVKMTVRQLARKSGVADEFIKFVEHGSVPGPEIITEFRPRLRTLWAILWGEARYHTGRKAGRQPGQR